MNLKKELGGVADAVTKIMDEALKGNQHKIDANKNGKVDAHDFKLLRAKKLAKEETDQVEEGYYKDMDTNRKEDERLAKKDSSPFGKPDKKKAKIATPGKFGYGYSAARHLARQGMASVTKEETEQVDEVIQKTSTGYIHHARPGVYGGSAKEKHVVDTLRGPKKSEIEAIEKEKKMKKSFSEMLDLINSQGLKALSEMIKEEPDNETFTKELKDQEAKAAGKKKQPDIAKGSVQAVKVEEGVFSSGQLKPSKELLAKAAKISSTGTIRSKDKQGSYTAKTVNHKEVSRVYDTKEEVEERSLTEPEMKKKEDIVKSMKKGLSGFKDRYGDRAKEVMYATATARAKKD